VSRFVITAEPPSTRSFVVYADDEEKARQLFRDARAKDPTLPSEVRIEADTERSFASDVVDNRVAPGA
jgi:hypothetical protein